MVLCYGSQSWLLQAHFHFLCQIKLLKFWNLSLHIFPWWWDAAETLRLAFVGHWSQKPFLLGAIFLTVPLPLESSSVFLGALRIKFTVWASAVILSWKRSGGLLSICGRSPQVFPLILCAAQWSFVNLHSYGIITTIQLKIFPHPRKVPLTICSPFFFPITTPGHHFCFYRLTFSGNFT